MTPYQSLMVPNIPLNQSSQQSWQTSRVHSDQMYAKCIRRTNWSRSCREVIYVSLNRCWAMWDMWLECTYNASKKVIFTSVRVVGFLGFLVMWARSDCLTSNTCVMLVSILQNSGLMNWMIIEMSLCWGLFKISLEKSTGTTNEGKALLGKIGISTNTGQGNAQQGEEAVTMNRGRLTR